MATRILVIEDDPGFAQLLKDVLETEGYAVTVARNGLEGLSSAQKEWPDLAITPFIPDSVKVNEANQHIVPVWKYAPGQASAEATRAVIEQLWTRSEGQALKEVA